MNTDPRDPTPNPSPQARRGKIALLCASQEGNHSTFVKIHPHYPTPNPFPQARRGKITLVCASEEGKIALFRVSEEEKISLFRVSEEGKNSPPLRQQRGGLGGEVLSFKTTH